MRFINHTDIELHQVRMRYSPTHVTAIERLGQHAHSLQL